MRLVRERMPKWASAIASRSSAPERLRVGDDLGITITLQCLDRRGVDALQQHGLDLFLGDGQAVHGRVVTQSAIARMRIFPQAAVP